MGQQIIPFIDLVMKEPIALGASVTVKDLLRIDPNCCDPITHLDVHGLSIELDEFVPATDQAQLIESPSLG